MANELTYGRKPQVIVELIQPRCSKRFGVAPCTATGTPKCFNCYWTCLDKANYDTGGSITWRFSRPQDDVPWLYEETDANNIKTNAIPLLISASHTSSRINPGASRTGESPLGRSATATITLANGVWDDHVGDFYLADRPARQTPSGFFTLMEARNTFYPGWKVIIYEGYEGQTLAQMQSRLFDVEQISGPNGNDQFQIQCRDPLDQLRGKNTKYPPTSQIDLLGDIDASTTDITVRCLEQELSLDLGNTGQTRYIVIGDEIISYTGWTGADPEWTLTGVKRGQIRSTPESHEDEAAVQRGAYHFDQRLYEVARYIIKDHTQVPNSYIDDAQWTSEGGTYLSTLRCRTFLPEPEAVEDLLGELGRDGLFSIWWDDRQQKIPLLAVRPPEGIPPVWNDDNNIAAFSSAKKIDDRMTRVTVRFGVRDWLEPLDKNTNYENRRLRIDVEAESETATGGKVVDNAIYSRWISTFSQALLVSASLLLRYRLPPQYLTLTLDAKDRSTQIGDVRDVVTRHIRDTEGQPIEGRWQIIGVEENKPGTQIQVMLQSFQFVGKFSIIMANDAPVYADTTETERLTGCWLSNDDGLMPDGTEGYLIQ